jgi:hypothetical protein
MLRLAEEIRARGGTPRDPRTTRPSIHDRLMSRIASRRDGSGERLHSQGGRPGARLPGRNPEDPGSGAAIYIASGTDEEYVLEEAASLGPGRVRPGPHLRRPRRITPISPRRWSYGASFPKTTWTEAAWSPSGTEYVEIADCKAAGRGRRGRGQRRIGAVETGRVENANGFWARARRYVVPDFSEAETLVDYIGADRDSRAGRVRRRAPGRPYRTLPFPARGGPWAISSWNKYMEVDRPWPSLPWRRGLVAHQVVGVRHLRGPRARW